MFPFLGVGAGRELNVRGMNFIPTDVYSKTRGSGLRHLAP